MVGISHRAFLVLSVTCLLSVFIKYAKKSAPASAPNAAFEANTTSNSWSLQSPKTTIFLALCYLFIVISLLVNAPDINMVEIAYNAGMTITQNLRSYPDALFIIT